MSRSTSHRLGRTKCGNSWLAFVLCLCEDMPPPKSGWWQAMSRTILLVIASAVTAGLLAVLVTAVRLAPGESAVRAGSVRSTPEEQRTSPVTTRNREGAVSQSRPVLIVLPGASASEHVGRLQSTYRVLTLLPPRILVLEADEAALTALRADANVAGVYDRTVPPDVLAGLGPEERLFVEGWIQQQAGKDKPRRGDGLSWDAPGFQPPGPPVKKQP
jgi:hypothetical protein